MSSLSPKRTQTPAAVRLAVCACLIAAALIAVGGCGASEPKSAATKQELKASLKGAPAPLAKLYSKGDVLLDGGPKAFKAQLAELRGYPVVVNKWASWCGPCRYEFPFFQNLSRKRGKQIAFLGVDGEDSRSDAEKFLAKFPVPYPSYEDPHDEIAKVFRGNRVFPTTAFYDSKGELVFTKQGGYASQAKLEEDVQQYAR